jgi:hypothetical protein
MAFPFRVDAPAGIVARGAFRAAIGGVFGRAFRMVVGTTAGADRRSAASASGARVTYFASGPSAACAVSAADTEYTGYARAVDADYARVRAANAFRVTEIPAGAAHYGRAQ